jgi:hypothetical protein
LCFISRKVYEGYQHARGARERFDLYELREVYVLYGKRCSILAGLQISIIRAA